MEPEATEGRVEPVERRRPQLRSVLVIGVLLLVVLGAGFAFAVWREHEFNTPLTVRVSDRPLRWFQFNDRGDRILIREALPKCEGPVRSVNRETGRPIEEFVMGISPLDVWAVSDDGERVASGSYAKREHDHRPIFTPNNVDVCAVRDPAHVTSFAVIAVGNLSFSADGQGLITDRGGNVEIRSVANGALTRSFDTGRGRAQRAGKDLLVVHEWRQREVGVHSLATGAFISTTAAMGFEPSVVSSPRAAMVASRRPESASVILQSLPDGREIQTLRLRGSEQWSLVLSREGDVAAVLGYEPRKGAWVEVFALETGVCLRSMKFGAERLPIAAFVPGEDTLAVSSHDGVIELYRFRR